jgi:ribosome-binding protein aMBF1 (putative translation factor)
LVSGPVASSPETLKRAREKPATVTPSHFTKVNKSSLTPSPSRVLADPVEGELVPFDVAHYVSDPVKAARIKAELSQEELAIRMGVSQAYVSKLEKARKVSPKVFHQVGLALAKPKRARRVLKKTGTSG